MVDLLGFTALLLVFAATSATAKENVKSFFTGGTGYIPYQGRFPPCSARRMKTLYYHAVSCHGFIRVPLNTRRSREETLHFSEDVLRQRQEPHVPALQQARLRGVLLGDGGFEVERDHLDAVPKIRRPCVDVHGLHVGWKRPRSETRHLQPEYICDPEGAMYKPLAKLFVFQDGNQYQVRENGGKHLQNRELKCTATYNHHCHKRVDPMMKYLGRTDEDLLGSDACMSGYWEYRNFQIINQLYDSHVVFSYNRPNLTVSRGYEYISKSEQYYVILSTANAYDRYAYMKDPTVKIRHEQQCYIRKMRPDLRELPEVIMMPYTWMDEFVVPKETAPDAPTRNKYTTQQPVPSTTTKPTPIEKPEKPKPIREGSINTPNVTSPIEKDPPKVKNPDEDDGSVGESDVTEKLSVFDKDYFDDQDIIAVAVKKQSGIKVKRGVKPSIGTFVGFVSAMLVAYMFI
ncbi:hypothetical protein L596_012763 [Steinernema carpocapsae]|uniref:Uncharacterized protein n=1 Tax=Steinernema carpocapsae TaxID=34508 RepID=A0A4U5NY82_STECR|nr:hypothetical protein L596_012763 [Steinernema carpocapsae]